MTVNIIELSYHPHAIFNLFAPLSNIEWSMLLYSGNNNNLNSRFDILVASPILTLVTKNNITTISHKNNHTIVTDTNPFILLKKYSSNISNKPTINNNLPFQGGLLGVFGYDLIKTIESLPTLTKKDLSFPDMAVGLYRWTIIVDHKLCKNYLITHDNPKKILTWIQSQKYTRNYIFPTTTSFQLLRPWISNITQSEYSKKFNIIKNHLISGNCYQICFSQRFTAPYIGDEWAIFCHLLSYNQAPFSAFIRLPNQLSILSLSPERFLQLQNLHIKTQPIKGTLPRLNNIKDDYNQIAKLSQSTKNKSENLMIVDLLRNDIGKVAIPGSIRVPKLFNIHSFSGVHHMISTITGKLANNFSACDLLHACFPGGSVTGAPKIQAMKIIEEIEPHCRGIWAGSIGYLSYCGNMDSNIIIRTLISENKHLFCSVGSGIVFDSNETMEYQEMQDKVSTLLLPLLKKSTW